MQSIGPSELNVSSLLRWLEDGFDGHWPKQIHSSAEYDPPSFVPMSKMWGEFALVFHQLARVSALDLKRSKVVSRLEAFIADPDFDERVIGRREHFSFYAQSLALVNALGSDVQDQRSLILDMLRTGALCVEDVPAWEKAEQLFNQACLGLEIAHEQVRSATTETILFNLPNSVFHFTELQAYRLTHTAFYHSGLGIRGLYQGSMADQINPIALQVMDLLCARFFVQGQLDLALELVLSKLLLGGTINALHAQCISAALDLADSLGFVPPYLFGYGAKQTPLESNRSAVSDFETNYHATLVFVLLLSTLKAQGQTEYITHFLSHRHTSANGRLILAYEDLSVWQFSAASEFVSVGALLGAVDIHQVERACYLFCELDKVGVIGVETHRYLYNSLSQWLALLRRSRHWQADCLAADQDPIGVDSSSEASMQRAAIALLAGKGI